MTTHPRTGTMGRYLADIGLDLDIPRTVPGPPLHLGAPVPRNTIPAGYRLDRLTPSGDLLIVPMERYTKARAAAVWADRRRGWRLTPHAARDLVGRGAATTTASLRTMDRPPPRPPLLTRAQRALFALAGLALLGLTLFAVITRYAGAALRLAVGG